MTREIALLVNPTAGKGAGARIAAVAQPRLADAGFRVRRLEGRDADEAADLARAAVEDGVESVVVVGGDGIVHTAVQALAHTPVSLGIIPAGTGNDAARSFGIPLKDPVAAADVVVGGRTRSVDLGRSGSTFFLCVLSAGFDAVVNERANRMTRPRGQLRYTWATLAELRVLRPFSYRLALDGTTEARDAVLVAVGNGPSFGGGLRITEGARLDDGLLDVVVIRPVGRAELVRTYPRLFRGSHVTHPAYEHHRVRQVTVTGPDVVVYADGERLAPLPVTVTAVPSALRVLTRETEVAG